MVTVLIGTQSNGQGHETAYSQLVSQHLDIPMDRIRVIQGDTDKVETGSGTGGSRSIPVGGAALDKATAILTDNLKQLASEKLEAGVGDLEIVDGAVRIVGTDKALDLKAIAALPGATPRLLKVHQSWDAAGGDLSERHPCLRAGGRSRDRRDRDPELRRGRRFRRDAEPDHAAGPGPWRCGAGHRPGADGGDPLRRVPARC